MNQSIFRKSTIDRVNSPEQLNEYIRVARPSVWVFLTAIIFFLAGIVLWGIFGTIETKTTVGLFVGTTEEESYCYISADNSSVTPGEEIVVMDNESREYRGRILSVDNTVYQAGYGSSQEDENTEKTYMFYLSDIPEGVYYRRIYVDIQGLQPGIYSSQIITDEIRPIEFVIH